MKDMKINQLAAYSQITGHSPSSKQKIRSNPELGNKTSEAQLASLVEKIKTASTEVYHQNKLHRIQQQVERNQFPLDLKECIEQFVLEAMTEGEDA